MLPEALWRKKVTQNRLKSTENLPKSLKIEPKITKSSRKSTKIIPKTSGFLLESMAESLQDAGGHWLKASINSEETRWVTPSAGQAFLGCGGLALAS